jgi:hypothetical protein
VGGLLYRATDNGPLWPIVSRGGLLSECMGPLISGHCGPFGAAGRAIVAVDCAIVASEGV